MVFLSCKDRAAYVFLHNQRKTCDNSFLNPKEKMEFLVNDVYITEYVFLSMGLFGFYLNSMNLNFFQCLDISMWDFIIAQFMIRWISSAIELIFFWILSIENYNNALDYLDYFVYLKFLFIFRSSMNDYCIPIFVCDSLFQVINSCMSLQKQDTLQDIFKNVVIFKIGFSMIQKSCWNNNTENFIATTEAQYNSMGQKVVIQRPGKICIKDIYFQTRFFQLNYIIKEIF